jgi:hypothetical protein
MLSAALVSEICRLIEEGQLSRRAIARQLGVSRGTVCGIANRRRGSHGKELENEPVECPTSGLPARCRGCGGMVVEPCLLCRARAYRERSEELRRLFRSMRGARFGAPTQRTRQSASEEAMAPIAMVAIRPSPPSEHGPPANVEAA